MLDQAHKQSDWTNSVGTVNQLSAEFDECVEQLVSLAGSGAARFNFHDRFGALTSHHTVMPAARFKKHSRYVMEFVASIPVEMRSDVCVSGNEVLLPLVDTDFTFAWMSLLTDQPNIISDSVFASCYSRLASVVTQFCSASVSMMSHLAVAEGRESPGMVTRLLINRKLQILEALEICSSQSESIGSFRASGFLSLADLDAEKALRSKVQSLFQQSLISRGVVDAVSARTDVSDHPCLIKIKPVVGCETLVLRLMRDALFEIEVIDPLSAVNAKRERLANALNLTRRQSEIAVQLALGATVAEVAANEDCSVETIRWHVRQLGNRLGITKQNRMVAYLSRVTTSLSC